MTSPRWDPAQYLLFEAERIRPFHDLVTRVQVTPPRRVVDLGCGPGNATATLLDRWPGACVLGIDSSPAMIECAHALAGPALSFSLQDIEAWSANAPVDVIVSNSALQWVPTHVALLPKWIEALTSGGALAFQVPANAEGPANQVFRRVAHSARWSARLAAIADSHGPGCAADVVRPTGEYVDVLGGFGCRVDAWDTTYYHVLPGRDPVLEWYTGTGLRPYLHALDPADRHRFRAGVSAERRAEFPSHPYGTILPFHRTFVIAYRP